MNGPCPSSDRKPSRPRAGLCHDRYDFYPLSYIDCESDAAPKWRGPPECVLISSIYRNPSLSRLPRIRRFSDVRVYTYVDITSARTPCHRIVLVPLSPNGERSIKRGLLGWVGGGFKCWRMIQRGHISVMRDVLGFYKLQIWRGVCRRKALLLVMKAPAGTYISETST